MACAEEQARSSRRRSCDELIAEAVAAPIEGWDFSWLDGRATEGRPSWGFQRLMFQRLASVSAALDIHTGGGEMLAEAEKFPPTMAATEWWPPNAALATRRLHPRGVVVLLTRAEPPLPFADEAFDLVPVVIPSPFGGVRLPAFCDRGAPISRSTRVRRRRLS